MPLYEYLPFASGIPQIGLFRVGYVNPLGQPEGRLTELTQRRTTLTSIILHLGEETPNFPLLVVKTTPSDKIDGRIDVRKNLWGFLGVFGKQHLGESTLILTLSTS